MNKQRNTQQQMKTITNNRKRKNAKITNSEQNQNKMEKATNNEQNKTKMNKTMKE